MTEEDIQIQLATHWQEPSCPSQEGISLALRVYQQPDPDHALAGAVMIEPRSPASRVHRQAGPDWDPDHAGVVTIELSVWTQNMEGVSP